MAKKTTTKKKTTTRKKTTTKTSKASIIGERPDREERRKK